MNPNGDAAMKLDQMPIEKLNAADYNPRADLQPGDPVYDNLKRSVETFGYLHSPSSSTGATTPSSAATSG